MKTLKDFYEDSWPGTTKYHRSEAPEFAFDVLGWWMRLKAEKLKGVMDRSKAYWAKKKEQKKRDLFKQKTEMMWEHRRRYKELLREVREEAVREAKENVSENIA